jgi:mono/diheme cytochrome c family protein
VARKIRNFAIPTSERQSKTTPDASPENLQQARELFIEHCASCHGLDGSARTQLGENLYPRVPDLRASQTQTLTDGELHYIIENGVQLTGMPAFTDLHEGSRRGAWLLVLYIRNLTKQNQAQKSPQAAAGSPVHFVGSQACGQVPRGNLRNVGRRRPWLTWCAIRASIRTLSSPI